MTKKEFFAWFHGKYLPIVALHTDYDVRYYRDVSGETMAFLTQTGNCYSWLNYACILAAWANEHFLSPLTKFVDFLEYPGRKNYWDTHRDSIGILPVESVDYED